MTQIILRPDEYYRINCEQILNKKIILSNNIYHEDLLNIVKYIDPKYHNTYFIFSFGDDTTIISDTNFGKARQIQDNYKHCLYLNHMSHYKPDYLEIAKNDPTTFIDKIPKAIWRGTSTNSMSRFNLIDKWGNHNNEMIDVAFTKLIKKYDKNYIIDKRISISELIEYKYQIVLEGNDVASCFSWACLSNCMLLMTKPKYTMITGQDKFISGYHYIEIKEDTSDLYEKILWCENNTDKCLEIINNKQKFINEFLNRDNYIISANIIENNLRSYIDKYELVVIIFYKVLLRRYVEPERPMDIFAMPYLLFNGIKSSQEFNNLDNKNIEYHYENGYINIKSEYETITLNLDNIVDEYNKNIDDSLNEIAKACYDKKHKPINTLIINNKFYICNYEINNDITYDEIFKILENEKKLYEDNEMNKRYML